MPLFNEVESLAESSDEEVFAPTKRRGKHKLLPADLPRVEVVHELLEHEMTCACDCRKHVIGEEISEQLEIVPMQIRVITHIRKVYGCLDCESSAVTADKPSQLIEKSMASPSVLAMLPESLLGSRIIHCDETRVQVLKEPGREPSSQSWMWMQTSGPPDQPVILFDYATSRAQEVPTRLLEGYRGYVMIDDYFRLQRVGRAGG